MNLHLHTITHNNEATITQFIEYYRKLVPGIVLHIHDANSTDSTVDLAREHCRVSKFTYRSIDDWKNNCWKNIPADCVILVNIDEYLELTPILFQNCTIVKSKGYSLQNLEESPSDENRDPNYDKICIFDPSAIKELNFQGEDCSPLGFIRLSEQRPNLYHVSNIHSPNA